jgi:DNA-binding CsgD family transcriptional regulator
MRVLRGRASSTGSPTPYRPLLEALLPLLPLTRPAGPRQEHVPGWTVRDVLPDQDGGGSAVVFAEVALRVMADAARSAGCLVVLEDLHDADAETLSAVEYLVDQVERQATAIVATTRTSSAPAMDLARSLARRGSGLIELSGLSRTEIGRLAALELDAEPSPELIERLWRDSGGNPWFAVELVRAWGSRPADEVPATLVRHIVARAEELGPEHSAALSAAAVIGTRFPVEALGRMLGVDEHESAERLRAAVDAGLLVPDADGYSFRHGATATALRGLLVTETRLALSARAARALLDTGDQALVAGRAELAAARLGRAVVLMSDVDDTRHAVEPRARARALDALLRAWTETGTVDSIGSAGDAIEALRGHDLDHDQLRALYLRLAALRGIAGRPDQGLAVVASAAALCGAGADGGMDLVTAELLAVTKTGDGDRRAEKLAHGARRQAEQAGASEFAVRALLLLGALARSRGRADATHCFERADLIATRHRLPALRPHVNAELAREDWLRTGRTEALDRAAQAARDRGLTVVERGIAGTLALHQVLCGRFDEAARTIGRAGTGNAATSLAEHILHAHQGRPPVDRPADRLTPLALGLGDVFRALLAEQRDIARAVLDHTAAIESADPAPLPLTGRHGLALLLKALHGEPCAPHSADGVTTLPWNRQFVLLAGAVRLGRLGMTGEAESAVTEAGEVGARYPLAHHLGLRLVSEAAIAEDWGTPDRWLRTAEQYFQDSPGQPIALACAALLRRLGAAPTVLGRTDIPEVLLAAGVTGREYEVLRLLVDRLSNRAIGTRLHISPRTVEKHVAQLLTKTGHHDRVTLGDFAMTVLHRQPDIDGVSSASRVMSSSRSAPGSSSAWR